MSLMQLTYGNQGGGQVSIGPGSGPNSQNQWPCPAGSCIANPPIQEILAGRDPGGIARQPLE